MGTQVTWLEAEIIDVFIVVDASKKERVQIFECLKFEMAINRNIQEATHELMKKPMSDDAFSLLKPLFSFTTVDLMLKAWRGENDDDILRTKFRRVITSSLDAEKANASEESSSSESEAAKAADIDQASEMSNDDHRIGEVKVTTVRYTFTKSPHTCDYCQESDHVREDCPGLLNGSRFASLRLRVDRENLLPCAVCGAKGFDKRDCRHGFDSQPPPQLTTVATSESQLRAPSQPLGFATKFCNTCKTNDHADKDCTVLDIPTDDTRQRGYSNPKKERSWPKTQK